MAKLFEDDGASWTPPAAQQGTQAPVFPSAPQSVSWAGAPTTGNAEDDYDIISVLGKDGTVNIPTGNQAPTAPAQTDPNIAALLASMQENQRLMQQASQQQLQNDTLRTQQEQQRHMQEQQRLLQQQQQQEQDAFLKSLIPTLPPEATQVTEEDRTKYGESAEFIRKQAAVEAQKVIQGMAPNLQRMAQQQFQLQQDLASLKAQNNPQNNQALTAERELNIIVRAQVPDIGELTAHPQFNAFRNANAVGGFTYGHLVDMAYKQGDATRLVNLLNTFRSGVQSGGKGRAQPPQSVNYQGGALANNPQAPRRQVLRESEYNEAFNKFMSGQMDEATYNAIEGQYQRALLEGNVIP